MEEEEFVKSFADKDQAIDFAKSLDQKSRVVFCPFPNSDEGEEYAEYIKNNSEYEDYEVVWPL